MKGCCWGEGAGRRGAHTDRALRCNTAMPQALQPQAPTRLSSFWLLYSWNHPRVTSFSDLGPPQAPFSSSHLLICYYCPALPPVRAQSSQACWRKKTCSADHSAGSLCCPNRIASYRAKLIAGPTGSCNSNGSSIVGLQIHQIPSQFL